MGADPMISGEMPTVAVETILPSGFRLRWRARFEDISSTAAAPSFRPGVKNKIQCFPLLRPTDIRLSRLSGQFSTEALYTGNRIQDNLLSQRKMVLYPV